MKWFDSLKSHHKRIYNLSDFSLTEDDVKKKFNYLYKGYAYQNKRRFLSDYTRPLETNWQNIYKKEYYIQEFNLRNAAIKKYFMDAPEKRLVLDITKESTTKKICHFLNIPEYLVFKTPILNRRP